MKYTVDYLSKQLKEASAIHDRYAKMLETDPGNAAVKIVARSMGDHVAEIKRDLKEARRAESGLSAASLPEAERERQNENLPALEISL